MTPTEFKAWLEGFLDAIGDSSSLSPSQVEKIKIKAKQVTKSNTYRNYTSPMYPTPGFDRYLLEV